MSPDDSQVANPIITVVEDKGIIEDAESQAKEEEVKVES
jgi:hypothetical protein